VSPLVAQRVSSQLRSELGSRPDLDLLAEIDPAATSERPLESAFQEEAARRAATGVVDARVKPLAEKLGQRLRADYLLLGFVSPAPGGYRLRTFFFRQRGSRLVELESIELDGELQNLAAGLFRLSDQVHGAITHFPEARDIGTAGPDGAGLPGTLGQTAPPTSDNRLLAPLASGEKTVTARASKPIYKRWWFWTLIGAAVAGGVTGGVVAATSRGNEPGYAGRVTLP
jgi:hypothetical protein